ncbi:hypothetical protein BC834DRAFT_973047 [Gloeopeniophorella convolvens]|nr:hypothetical protein BC834DRAFT_973047 [Gloeopeniophorella convolvens]
MDGSANVNLSNAPSHTYTVQEAKKLERTIAKDAAAAEKHLTHVGKTLKSAEKEESKVEKATHKSERTRDKTIKQEHKTAEKLGAAEHNHDVAVANEHKAVHDLEMRQKYLQEAQQGVESRRAELEQIQRRKEAGDTVREEHLNQIRQATASSGAAGA